MSPAPAQRIPSSRRGSVVLVALGFTVVLGIATAGFLTACFRSTQLSNRSFNGARSIQFAEMGMEEALWSLKNNDWSDWTLKTGTATRTITGFTSADGCSGEIYLRLQGYNTNSVGLVVEGRTLLPDGSTIRKQLVATATQAPVFTNTLFSAHTTTFTEGGTIDSYNSADGPYVGGNAAGFSAIVAGSSIDSPTAASVIANNANIKGYIAYTGLAPTFGGSGSLRGPASQLNPRVDPARFSTSPWQHFPEIKPVTGGSPLPSGSFTIGTAGATVPSVYYAGDLIMTDAQTIVVDGPVVLGLSGKLSIDDSGAQIVVTPTGSLEIHCAGNVLISGLGIRNQSGDPKKFALLCTASSTDFTAHIYASPYVFYGVLYLPAAALALNDSVQIHGAVVADSIRLSGWADPQVHYDVSLRTPAATFAGLATVYQLTNWREITDPAELTQF